MEIIFVIESLSKNGGAENALVNLAIELKKQNHVPTIIHLMGPNDFREELLCNNIYFYSLEMASRWDLIKGILGISKILSNLEATLINAHNFFPMMYVGLSKLTVPGKKRIVTYHNMGYEVYPAKSLFHKIRKFLDIVLNRFCFDGFLAVSTAVANSYQKHLGILKITVIENPIPIDSILVHGSLKKHIKKDAQHINSIVMAGRFVPEKGYEYMLDAMQILIKKSIKCKLTIYGEGPLRKSVKNQIKAKNLDNIILVESALPHRELFPIIQSSDIFAMSSVSEGFPMAPAEAMVLGTPVVATRVGGIPELIEHGKSGILVPPRNPKMLADALFSILSDDNLSKYLSENARYRVAQNFSSSSICNKLINFYSWVLASHE